MFAEPESLRLLPDVPENASPGDSIETPLPPGTCVAQIDEDDDFDDFDDDFDDDFEDDFDDDFDDDDLDDDDDEDEEFDDP